MATIEEFVKNKIIECWHYASIMDIETPICDMIVEISECELKFALEVKTITAYKADDKQDFKNHLARAVYRQGAPNIPVIIALVDDINNTVIMGIALQWRFHTPIIEDDISFVELSPNNADVILDNIKAADSVIRALSNTNLKVVKKISFSFEQGGLYHQGYVIYLRDLRQGYKMNCKTPDTQQEEFDRFLNGIPEDEYPSDIIDEKILEAVEKKYHDSKIKSSLLVFSTELRDLKHILSLSRNFDGGIEILPIIDGCNHPKNNISIPIDIQLDTIFTGVQPVTQFTTTFKALNFQELEEFAELCSTVKRPQAIFISHSSKDL